MYVPLALTRHSDPLTPTPSSLFSSSLPLVATLYELRSAAGADKKRELLVEVAKWAGDGLRTTCLKMPTN